MKPALINITSVCALSLFLLACSPEQFLKNIAGKNSKNDNPKTEEKAEPKLIWSRFDSKDMAKSFPNAVLSCELYYFQSKLTSDELPSQPADGFQWKVSESPNTKTILFHFLKAKRNT